MRHSYLSALLLLVAIYPAEAGRYDDPSFLTSHLVSGGVAKDGIPALTNPIFVAPNEVNYVQENDVVMGIVINGEPRAYPHNIGWWNEIINDRVGDQSVVVSLCPLTGTGQVFNATDGDGSQIEFGVSGLLINSNLVMYDRRDGETLYPQMIYTAINGDRAGDRLELMPVVETTWVLWQRMYPSTTVVQATTGWEYYNSRPAYNENQYTFYPYGSYRTSHTFLLFPPTTNGGAFDNRFETKDLVLGLCRGDQTKAFPFALMPDGAVINNLIGGDPVVVLFDYASRTALAYFSQLDETPLSFYGVESEGPLPVEFMDAKTGSRWNMLGEAVAGPLAGRRLAQVPAYNAMWFAWTAYWPDTEVWQPGEGILSAEDIEQIEQAATAVEALDSTPTNFALNQNFPNPFNAQTIIQYELPVAGSVRLGVFNAAGQRVRLLVNEHQTAGLYLQPWDGRDDAGQPVASGAYLYQLEAPTTGFVQARGMVLVR